MKEIWKDIPNYEGIYKCSNLGRIISVERVVEEKTGKKRMCKQVVRKLTLNKNGYFYVTLKKQNASKHHIVHRLVAISFLVPIKDKNIVNHKNGTEIHKLANELTDKEVNNILGGWNNDSDKKYVEQFERFVKMGDSRPLAIMTVIAEKYKETNNEFYINAYEK